MKKNKNLKTKKNNKALFNTVEDDRIVRIYLILFCLGFAGVFLVYYFIKHCVAYMGNISLKAL